MNAAECISSFACLLSHYGTVMERAVAASGQAEEPPPYAMRIAFRFGQQTLEAIQLLLTRPEQIIFTNTLIRPFYELAIRLLWASREPDGWERFQAYVAKQDRTWALEAQHNPDLREHAEKILASREEVLARTDDKGHGFAPMPRMKQALQGIERRDIEEGEIEAPGGAAFQYTNVYRTLCRPAHGHIPAIEDTPPSAALMFTIFGAGLATHALIRALYYMSGNDPGLKIQRAGEEILNVLRQAKYVRPGETNSKQTSDDELQQ